MDQQEFQTQVLEFMAEMRTFKHISEQQFTHIHQRLEMIHEDIRDLKHDVRDLQKQVSVQENKLYDIHQARNTVKIKFGWEWSAVSTAIAFISSLMASVLTKFAWK